MTRSRHSSRNSGKRDAIAALALELCILTAARSGEILGMRWDEIDFGKKIWTVPAHRMKAGREHRVPLSHRATAILVRLTEERSGDFVFPGQRRDKPLSNMAMEMMLRRMKIDATEKFRIGPSFSFGANPMTRVDFRFYKSVTF